MPSLMCGCSGIHPLQQHIRLGIDLFATACLIEEGLACHLGGSWQELRAAWTKWKIPRKRTCSFLGIFHFVPENSCFEVFCNKDVLVRGITTLYHDPVTEIFILQKHVFNVWTSQCVCTTHQLRTCAIVPHGPKDGKGRKKIPRKEQGREVSLETLKAELASQRLQAHFTSLLFPGYLPLRARELVLFGVLQQRCSGPCIHAKLYVCRQVAWKLR